MMAVLAVASATPAYSEGTVYSPVGGGKDIVVEKYLIMDKEANVPNVTFRYSIAPGPAQNAEDSVLQVFAGDDASKVTGTPTIGTAVFAAGQTTYSDVQTLPDTVNTQKKSDGTNINQDPVTLEAGKQKYARSDIKVDFSGVSFKEPGVYRYIVTESAGNEDLGIVNDNDTTRIMDVYVTEDPQSAGSLVVEGYVLHNQESTGAVKADGSSASQKAAGFVNHYETEELTLSKTVTGNQASHDEYFAFTVNITGAVPGTVYDVDLAAADAVTKKNGFNTDSYTNPAQLTADANGSVTQMYWLQHGQHIVIHGLAKNTGYEISENKETMQKEGYSVQADIAGDTKNGDGAQAADMALSSSLAVEDSAITKDTQVSYTNHRAGTIPTGVAMQVMPFAAVTLLGVAGAVSISMRRRREEE